MSFKLENFVAAPSMELFNLVKKTDLLNIADHYALTSVKPSMLKHEIKNILIKFLVDEEILDSSALSSILITQTDLQLRELEVQRQIQLKKLRLEQEERIRVEQLEREERIRVGQLEREERMQKEKLAMERKKLAMEIKFRNGGANSKRRIRTGRKRKEQYNLRMKELEMQDKAKTKPLDLGTHFDVTKHIRLVPPFQEKEVDKYFLHFEKVAENLKWPKEHWTLLLQSVVIGKARENYTELSLEQSSDYDKVKELILKAYELVPEAYRQKFRTAEQKMTRRMLNLLELKNNYLTDGALQNKIGSDYPKLRQLMLVEEFQRCINSDVKSFLDEKEVETLEKAARLADDYTLTHKVSFVSKANPRKPFYPTSGHKPSPSFQSGNSNQNAPKPKPPGEKQRSQSLISVYLQLLQTIRSY